jgi:predicted amino acid-binding ACT domain protein
MMEMEQSTSSTFRLCISNINKPGVLGQLTTLVASYSFNIVRQSNRATEGDLALSIIDISNTNSSTRTVETLLVAINAMDGVVSCNLGHFDRTVSLSATSVSSTRFCIVNEDRVGVLGVISSTLGALHLNIASQRNRSHIGQEHLALTIIDLDIDVNDDRLQEAALQITTINGVLSCDVGTFAPGSLTKIRQRTPSNSINQQVPLSSLPLYNDTAKTVTTISSKKSTSPAFSSYATLSSAANARHPLLAPSSAFAFASASTFTTASTAASTATSTATSTTTTIATTTTATATQADGYYHGDKSSSFVERRTEQLEVISRRSASTLDATQLLLVMVGLPARGKSFTARKLASFLNWGTKTIAKIFNAGKYRRQVQEEKASIDTSNPGHRDKTSSFNASKDGAASFFSNENKDAKIQREEAADAALSDILQWFFQEEAPNKCAIFDATNSTRSRRKHIVKRFAPYSSVRVVFIEVICNDEIILNENILYKVRCSPDYNGMSLNDAVHDFQTRISNYTQVYEPINKIQDRNLSYIQIEDMGNSAVLNKIYGRMTTLVLPYLMALHVGIRPIWLLCIDEETSGSSDYGKLETRSFHSHASLLSEWLRTAIFLSGGGGVLAHDNSTSSNGIDDVLPVFTSSYETGYSIASDLISITGEIKNENQYRIMHRVRDVLRPQSTGKTNRQLCGRLLTMAIELEQQTSPTVVIAGSRVLRGLTSYFLRVSFDSCHVPRSNDIIELMPSQGGGWKEHVHHLNLPGKS